MASQRKDNLSNDTLDMRTLVNFVMPDTSSCPDAVRNIAEIYLEGDVRNRVAKHRVQIFTDIRMRAKNKYARSKVLDRTKNLPKTCPYIK